MISDTVENLILLKSKIIISSKNALLLQFLENHGEEMKTKMILEITASSVTR